MLKTTFREIVSLDHIGKSENPVVMNGLFQKAVSEKTSPSAEDKTKSILLAIDVQKDFMEGGALGVTGSLKDVENLTVWIYENLERLTSITASLDTHTVFQIFHPCWWVDSNNENPPPFTPITAEDLDKKKWTPVIHQEWSREYVVNLQTRNKTLVIWPYHCIQGTSGHSFENQFANMVYFHSAARQTGAVILSKGNDPLTEMYGIFKPEYSKQDETNIRALSELGKYDKIIVAGEAKSHCVLESVGQILEFYSGNMEMAKKIYILEDCMSCIPGFEKQTKAAYEEFSNHYGVNLVRSTDIKL